MSPLASSLCDAYRKTSSLEDQSSDKKDAFSEEGKVASRDEETDHSPRRASMTVYSALSEYVLGYASAENVRGRRTQRERRESWNLVAGRGYELRNTDTQRSKRPLHGPGWNSD